jgi:hypothetical protein
MRVQKNWLDANGEPMPGTFRNHPTRSDGMSTDWNKYATPEECRLRGRTPSDNAVIQLMVEDVRKIPEQVVEHTPIYEPLSDPPLFNRAHTDVFGDKDKNTEVRFHFMKIYSFVIKLDQKP